MLVYDWVVGERIGVPRPQRNDPQSSFRRFRNLSVAEILRVLDTIYALHHQLARLGWIAVDFYDGCLMYHFKTQKFHVIDLDMYRSGPFPNDMGRMFGSSRFMAPEEFILGAEINQRTNVFTMGRTAFVFLADGTLDRAAFRGDDALYDVLGCACAEIPGDRFASLADFYSAWSKARLN